MTEQQYDPAVHAAAHAAAGQVRDAFAAVDRAADATPMLSLVTLAEASAHRFDTLRSVIGKARAQGLSWEQIAMASQMEAADVRQLVEG